MERLLARLSEMEEKASALRARRDELNAEAARWAAKSGGLNARAKELRAEADRHRLERDGINRRVRNFKEKRLGLERQIAEKKAGIDGLAEKLGALRHRLAADPKLTEERIRELDWRLQTSVLSPAEEKRIVEEIRDLKRKLVPWKEIQKLMDETAKLESEARILRDQARASYKEMAPLAEESGVHHAKMIEALEEARRVQASADEAQGEFIRVKTEADVTHEQYFQTRSEIEALSEEMARLERESQEEKDRRVSQMLEDEAVEKLRKGEKLTLEDLKILVKKGLIQTP